MRVTDTGLGFTPDNVQNTGSPKSTGDLSPTPGDLRPRGSSESTAPRRNSLTPSAGSSPEISARLNEVAAHLNATGIAMLQQGAKDGFGTLPPQYRSLALQTARLVGVMTEPTPPGPAMPFSALANRLEAVTPTSSQPVESVKLDMASALRQDPGRRATMLAPHLTELRNAGRVTAAAVAQMPVAELLANKELVKEKLTAWAGTTETIHEQLKAQLGDRHPTTVAALEARTEASAAYGKTMLRMAASRLGRMAFNMTVGPVIAGAARLFGSGN